MKHIYLLYKTVRIETGEYYIGIHGIDTDKYPDFNDGYLGSGNRLLASVKKCGRKSFRRSLLAISEDRKVILALEEQQVTREMVSDPLCLNLAIGGRVGVEGVSPSAETRQKLSDANKGKTLSAEHCQKLSDSRKGKTQSAETRQKISDGMKGVPKCPRSAIHCQKISDAKKEYWRQRKQNSSSTLESFLQ